MLYRAVIIEGAEAKGKVALGSTLVIQDTQTGESFEIQIVAPAEASVLVEPMKVSDESPVGSAVLGKRAGDVIRVEVPTGEVKEYRVLSILE